MEYRAVRFSLEAGYVWGQGMSNDQYQRFEAEIVGLFVDNGWKVEERKMASSCPTVTRGKNRLYLHPMDASGELEVGKIDSVKELLQGGKTFRLTGVHINEVLVDMSDEEYTAKLIEQKDAIKADLLGALKTKRKNQYISGPRVVEMVKERYHIQRLCSHIGRSSLNPEWQFVSEMLQELAKEGRIVAHPQQSYAFRAI